MANTVLEVFALSIRKFLLFNNIKFTGNAPALSFSNRNILLFTNTSLFIVIASLVTFRLLLAVVVVDETPSESTTAPSSGMVKGVVVINALGLPDVISTPLRYSFLVVVSSPILTVLSKSYSLAPSNLSLDPVSFAKTKSPFNTLSFLRLIASSPSKLL